MAKLCKAFGCDVAICDVIDYSKEAKDLGYHWLRFEELLGFSEIVTFHVPLTSETRQMLSGARLEMLQDHTIIVNTSRGEVLDQTSLRNMLRAGSIAGLGLDVYEEEPLLDKDLYSQEKFLGTAHIAGNSVEAVEKMGGAALNGVAKFLLDQ